MTKRYYWLKLPENVFQDLSFKKIRKLPGGAELTVIYLKMMLMSIKNEGYIVQQNINDKLETELSLLLDEDENAVLMLLTFLKKENLIIEQNEQSYYLPEAAKKIGSESESAIRMRKLRNSQLESSTSHCDANVTKSDGNVTIEKRREEIDNNKINILLLKSETFTNSNKNIANLKNPDNLDYLNFLDNPKDEWSKVINTQEKENKKPQITLLDNIIMTYGEIFDLYEKCALDKTLLNEFLIKFSEQIKGGKWSTMYRQYNSAKRYLDNFLEDKGKNKFELQKKYCKKYLTSIWLSDNQYVQLKDLYEKEELLDEGLQILEDWKITSHRENTYYDDFTALKNWVLTNIKKKYGLMQSKKTKTIFVNSPKTPTYKEIEEKVMKKRGLIQ